MFDRWFGFSRPRLVCAHWHAWYRLMCARARAVCGAAAHSLVKQVSLNIITVHPICAVTEATVLSQALKASIS